MEITSHFIHRADGTRLRAFDTGGPGPAIILANGLGGPRSAFTAYFRRLSLSMRVISWDYRGLYGSTLANDQADLSVPAHASDVHAVLEHLGVTRCAFLGWSMGVQVGLEVYRQEKVELTHLILMSGTFGHPFRGVPIPGSERFMGHLIKQAERVHFVGGPLLRGIRKTTLGAPLLKGLGVIDNAFDEELFATMLEDFETINFRLYMRLLMRLSEHDAESLLPTVRVPTLVVTGSKDRITPSYSARRIADKIPGAEFLMIPGATHYAAAEYPTQILERLVPFLAGAERNPLSLSETPKRWQAGDR